MKHQEDSTFLAIIKPLLAGLIVAVILFVVILNIFLGCNTSTRDD